jgi:hypothetical protein
MWCNAAGAMPQGAAMLSSISKRKQYLKDKISQKGLPYQARLIQGHVHLECRDPLVVRADVLVLDAPSQTLSAVVDGMLAEFGPIENDIQAALAAHAHAAVAAPHFDGGWVARQVPVIVRG